MGVEQRPPQVHTRERFGDWEGDTVVGSHQHGFIATVVERKSRLLRACLVASKEAGALSVVDLELEDVEESPLAE